MDSPKGALPGSGELSLFFTDDAGISELNLRYLGRSGPTNVLAFPLSEGESDFFAEIVISVETAEREARSSGRSREERIEELLIHGILHLVGYDHEDPGRARRMRAKEKALALRIRSGARGETG